MKFSLEPTYFRRLAGKLQYLTLTRPDLQFAVNLVCQRMHKPNVADFHMLKRVLRYIKGTLTMGLHFYSNSNSSLKAFCDSDWAGCSETRRSTGGFSTLLGSNLISWSAKKQDSVSRSSAEAEYRCLSDTAAEISWISEVLSELGFPATKPAEAYCDNLSAVHLTANPVLHKKSKHFATHYHYAREQVAKGSLIVHHVSAASQIADIFMKSLPQASFYSLRSKLGVVANPTTSLRGGISTAQKPITKPASNLQQDKAATRSRAQGCCAQRTEKQSIHLGNRYTLLSVAT